MTLPPSQDNFDPRPTDLTYYMRLPYATEILIDSCDGKPCYVARHPELYGCMAQGDTPQEAVAELERARSDYIAALLVSNIQVPVPDPARAIARSEPMTPVAKITMWGNAEAGNRAMRPLAKTPVIILDWANPTSISVGADAGRTTDLNEMMRAS
jgi:predicted RNase H-like HicB family nuclease